MGVAKPLDVKALLPYLFCMPAHKRPNPASESINEVLTGLTVLEAKELNAFLRDEYGIEPDLAVFVPDEEFFSKLGAQTGKAIFAELPDPVSIVIETSLKVAREAIISADETLKSSQTVLDRMNARLAKAS